MDCVHTLRSALVPSIHRWSMWSLLLQWHWFWSSLLPAALQTGHDNVVDEFKHCEDTGSKQQAHETTYLTEQTRKSKCLVLFDVLVCELLVEDVYLEEILPAKCTDKSICNEEQCDWRKGVQKLVDIIILVQNVNVDEILHGNQYYRVQTRTLSPDPALPGSKMLETTLRQALIDKSHKPCLYLS